MVLEGQMDLIISNLGLEAIDQQVAKQAVTLLVV